MQIWGNMLLKGKYNGQSILHNKKICFISKKEETKGLFGKSNFNFLKTGLKNFKKSIEFIIVKYYILSLKTFNISMIHIEKYC